MIAAHESARTTKLYDRTSDQISLDEVERMRSELAKHPRLTSTCRLSEQDEAVCVGHECAVSRRSGGTSHR